MLHVGSSLHSPTHRRHQIVHGAPCLHVKAYTPTTQSAHPDHDLAPTLLACASPRIALASTACAILPSPESRTSCPLDRVPQGSARFCASRISFIQAAYNLLPLMLRTGGMLTEPPLDTPPAAAVDGHVRLVSLLLVGVGCAECSGVSLERKLVELVARWWARGGTGPTCTCAEERVLLRVLWLDKLCSGLSTTMIMMTPTLPSEPVSGVQCIQRGLPSAASSVVVMLASSGGEMRVSQEIFAVTPMPCERASTSESRTCSGPPMWSRSLDWQSPGMRSEGEVKIMRSEG